MTPPPAYARAAVMVEPGAPLVLQQFPVPRPGPGELLVRVDCCTICRSDLHTFNGRRPGPLPAILGHEIVGTVTLLGDRVEADAAGERLGPGDRVTWTLHSSCGECEYCRVFDLPMKCEALKKYGHQACDEPPHLQGGFAEYCLVDAGTSVFRLPGGLSDTVAAPANCALATVTAAWESAGVQPMRNVLILGAGALGLYASAYAAHAGCGRVIVADVSPERLELAKRFGASDCLDMSRLGEAEAVAMVQRLTGGYGVDCAFELAGAPAVYELGVGALRKGGAFVEVGCSFPGARVTLDLSLLQSRLLTIRGVHNYAARHLKRAVGFLADTADRFAYEEIVGARFGLDQINQALRVADSRAAARVAVIPGSPA